MMTDPKITLTFTANDLEPGHNTTQVLADCDLIRDSFDFKRSRLNGLKSSSDTITFQIVRGCASVEDIIATEGDIVAVLEDDGTVLFTGYLSTAYTYGVTEHGEEILNMTLESKGTRLFNKPFIESGKHFFDCLAYVAVQGIVTPLGITLNPNDVNKLQQPVRRTVEPGETCRELMDSLLYECNCVYYFNASGLLCVQEIEADTEDAPVFDKTKLRMVDKKVYTLSKKLRTYSGARVAYTELAEADNYLVYRNTTGQDSSHPYCNFELQAGEYFDGTEIYTAAEWAEAQADTFREPALIGAVNAASESQIVGSNKIVDISNLSPTVVGAGMTCVFQNVGGGYFKLTAHNESGGARQFQRMDLYASIVYVKSNGVIRTQIDGPSSGKSILEEELKWIHDQENATLHANLLAQYHRYASAAYTFYTNENIPLGSVVKLHDDVYSGLEVYALVTASEKSDRSATYAYSAVGVSTFNLEEDAYHGVSEEAKQSGPQGPQGVPGPTPEIQYALGTSPDYPPLSGAMLWEGEQMLWDDEPMYWDDSTWTDTVPLLTRGYYLWMRVRVGEDSEWTYSRISATYASLPTSLGAVTSLPTETPEGQPLIPGDYFIVATAFTDSGVTYRKGFVYEYKGPGWRLVDFSRPENSGKGLNSLAAILEDGTDVTDSTASLYGWFKNLVSQNGIIANLISRNLVVGDGNGTSGSGFRFRAREYNQYGQKLSKPDFDVYFGDKMLFSVDSSGKIFFGSGFWYDPSGEGSIRSRNDGIVIDGFGAITINKGLYKSNLVCPSFRSIPRDTPQSPLIVSYPQNATVLGNALQNSGIVDLVPCSVSGNSDIALCGYSEVNQGSYIYKEYRFYKANMESAGVGYLSNSYSGSWNFSGSSSFLSSNVFTFGTISQVVFKLLTENEDLSISTLSSSLEKGEFYYVPDSGGTTGTVHVKL